jgi:hypothetical protein
MFLPRSEILPAIVWRSSFSERPCIDRVAD